MFTLSATHRFHLYSLPTDMRKGFNGLSGIIENHLETNSKNGDVYIFINKGRDKIKLLHWQGAGFTLYYKRLESGTFELPDYGDLEGSISLKYAQMIMILDGLSIKNIQTRKRYRS
jgi:transposase